MYDFTPPQKDNMIVRDTTSLSEVECVFLFYKATGCPIAESKHYVQKNLGGYQLLGAIGDLIRAYHEKQYKDLEASI